MVLPPLQPDGPWRQRQNRVQSGTVSSVRKRKGSPCQQDGDENSHASKTMRHSLPDLPEDIWRHIHSLLPLHDAARASCVSHAFLRSWRCHPILTLNRDTLQSKAHECGKTISHTIDCILRRHSGIGIKILKLRLHDLVTDKLDSWLQAAVVPGIEELTLMLERSKMEYNFPCSLLSEGIRNSIRVLNLGFCIFRPTPELGPLRSLTSLRLSAVIITEYELECFFSHSLALEQLELTDCMKIVCLKIPCELQRLSYLKVLDCRRLLVIESKAPNLSSLAVSGTAKLLFEETLQMKNLSLNYPNAIRYTRAELPSIMPNLETLDLRSDEDVNTPMLPTKFMYLKHLSISIRSGFTHDPPYDYVSLVSFLDASPSLETLILDVSHEHKGRETVFGNSWCLRQTAERQYCCLKSVKITGFRCAKSLVELTCHILKSAVSLESLTLDTLYGWRCSEENFSRCFPMQKSFLKEAPRALEAIRTYIKDKVPATAKLTVVEPCSRCHKVTRR